MGAVDAYYSEIQVVIEGTGDAAVILQGLEVVVLERRPPMSGLLVSQLGGDLIDVRFIEVDLDSTPPSMVLGSGYIEGEGDWSFPLRVTVNEPEVLHLFASTSNCDCLWVAELAYVHGGKQYSLKIDNDGEPFRTTAPQNVNDRYILTADGSVVSEQDW